MAFPPSVAEELLVRCHRHCCLCHKPAGNKIEIHHIVPKSEGGDDSAENGIPLCFDCHAEVQSYNAKHPRGRRFTASELRKHREQWFAIASTPDWRRPGLATARHEPTESVRALLERLGKAELWNPDNATPVLSSVRVFHEQEREALVTGLADALDSEDENRRWDAAIIIEFLVEWDPIRVPGELVRKMARDPVFSVRSSAAVSYCFMAASSPDEVPLDVLRALARYDEDWYVLTPATSALRRLARARPVAIEFLLEGLDEEDPDARRHSGMALRHLIREHPAAARWDVVERLEDAVDPELREIGREWRSVLDGRIERGLGTDYGIF